MIVRADEVAGTDRGTLVNFRHGYDLHWLRSERWGLFWSKAIHEFTLDPVSPLTWQDRQGGYWQPDRHEMETDLGSIPPPLRSWFPQDQFEPAYCLHDSAYNHGGMYFSTRLDGPYEFREVSRRWSDDMLADVIYCLGGWAPRRGLIWAAVRAGGWASFNDGKGGSSTSNPSGCQVPSLVEPAS